MARSCNNFVDGRDVASESSERLEVHNPATGQVIAELPLSTESEVNQVVTSSQKAFEVWKETPVVERARVLFRFKQKLEEHRQELAELVVTDNGKTLAEAQGSVQRGIEVVEFATGIPSHSMGSIVEDIARGMDCEMVRQPVGVVAGFTPFNFPVMVPLWMIPMAVACGNTFILKPSERAPLASVRLVQPVPQITICHEAYLKRHRDFVECTILINDDSSHIVQILHLLTFDHTITT